MSVTLELGAVVLVDVVLGLLDLESPGFSCFLVEDVVGESVACVVVSILLVRVVGVLVEKEVGCEAIVAVTVMVLLLPPNLPLFEVGFPLEIVVVLGKFKGLTWFCC